MEVRFWLRALKVYIPLAGCEPLPQAEAAYDGFRLDSDALDPSCTDNDLSDIIIRVVVIIRDDMMIEMFMTAKINPFSRILHTLPEGVSLDRMIAQAIPDHLKRRKVAV